MNVTSYHRLSPVSPVRPKMQQLGFCQSACPGWALLRSSGLPDDPSLQGSNIPAGYTTSIVGCSSVFIKTRKTWPCKDSGMHAFLSTLLPRFRPSFHHSHSAVSVLPWASGFIQLSSKTFTVDSQFSFSPSLLCTGHIKTNKFLKVPYTPMCLYFSLYLFVVLHFARGLFFISPSGHS